MRPKWTVPILAVILLAWTPASVVAESHWSLQVATTEPVSFAGTLNANGDGFVARWQQEADVRLEADRVKVWMEIAEGERVLSPTGDQVRYQAEHRHENRSFEKATITLEAWRSPGVALVEQGPSVTSSIEAEGETSLLGIENRTLAWAGSRDSSSQGEGTPEYEYRIGRTVPFLRGADIGEARGDFTLFADNVTIEVRQQGKEIWSNWTGFRSQRTAGSFEEYELRVSKLLVEGGRMTVRAPEQISLLGGRDRGHERWGDKGNFRRRQDPLPG